ncbi:MAG: protein kinase [Propionibacteriaceae bacterium]|nr:protein kinase [Propionibacteriaceae bacterium]
MRTRQQAPTIPGLTYKGFLGSGGYADVFLYESSNPVRDVAVKVLHEKSLNAQLIRRFADEANTMAALEHPYVVRVYSSGLTQDGRPYIEMAYYPLQTLVQAVAQGPMPVPEVLRIGVQLASAVQAAHEVGLLHRDIKPANVLLDRFSDPALTDFGVSSFLHVEDETEASLSVPWAPPEAMFSNAPLDHRGDVYSLAATLWHLLVGHSPFEVPGGDNKPGALMVRVRDLPVPSLGRPDVPSSLERLLKQAMSKEPRMRVPTAEELARGLNEIEEELGLRPTAFKVARAPIPPKPFVREMDMGPTQARQAAPVAQYQPQPTPEPPAVAPQAPEPTRVRPIVLHEYAEPEPADEPRASKKTIIIGVIVLAAIVIAVIALIFIGRGEKEEPPSNLPTLSVEPPFEDSYPGKAVVTGAIVDSKATFTWTYDYRVISDFFLVEVEINDLPMGTQTLSDPEFSIDYHDGEKVCVTVRVSRGSGGYVQLDGKKGCVP